MGRWLEITPLSSRQIVLLDRFGKLVVAPFASSEFPQPFSLHSVFSILSGVRNVQHSDERNGNTEFVVGTCAALLPNLVKQLSWVWYWHGLACKIQRMRSANPHPFLP